MMVEIKRLLAVLALAFSCVIMWGCGDWFPEDGEREFFGYYSRPHIVGFIDDSLVIVADDKEWTQETSDGYAIEGRGHQRLRIFNYRVQEAGPRWTDTLDNFNDECNYALGQLSDSVIWGGQTSLYTEVWEGPVMTFWKIGEKPNEVEIEKVLDGCKVDFRISRLRKWLDGTILALDEKSLNATGDACQYAVLDTVALTITYKKLDENLKWIEKCDDVSAYNNEIFCIALKRDSLGISLWVDNDESDMIEHPEWPKSYMGNRNFILYGKMLRINGNIHSVDFEKRKIIRQYETYLLSVSRPEFQNESGEIVSYK